MSTLRIEKSSQNAETNFGIIIASLYKEGIRFKAYEEDGAYVAEFLGY